MLHKIRESLWVKNKMVVIAHTARKILWPLERRQITYCILFLHYARSAFGLLSGYWSLLGKLAGIAVLNVAVKSSSTQPICLGMLFPLSFVTSLPNSSFKWD